MLTKTFSSAVYGIDAATITVETNTATAQEPKYFIVGLPDTAVKESMFRVEAALKNTGYRMPRMRIVVNLSPADIRKEGSAYDLPIALGIMGSSEQLMSTEKLAIHIIVGELSLDGTLQPIKGALPIAIQARAENFEGIILPKQNAREAGIVNKLKVYGVETLSEVVEFINGNRELEQTIIDTRKQFAEQQEKLDIDFSEVKGQENIKRALEIAAAGGHNAILIGPPGAGKTMLAKRLPTILPPLTLNEALETTKIHSVAGKIKDEGSLVSIRPFCSPHHTVSDVALVGGGGNPQPGEISLAHHGVLFLDELPEFKRTVLEVMRQPMEERRVTISRARMSIEFPASFMMVASMNPCPCGFRGDPKRNCNCSPIQVERYLSRISGPLLDRIDIHVEVPPVPFRELSNDKVGTNSQTMRECVIAARERQKHRFRETPGALNGTMAPRQIRSYCKLESDAESLLKAAMEEMGLSARAHDKILRVSRTIADLDNSDSITAVHLSEAIGYRTLDRVYWAG